MRDSIVETLGTPLVRIADLDGRTVAAKIESFNPSGSAKARPAIAMIRQAEQDGNISPGDRIVEPTSGNTGIGLAMACAALGYELTVVMPASKSSERRQLMRAYGADIELVEGEIDTARERAKEIAANGAVYLNQFSNPANPQSHYRGTGREILNQVGDRSIDAFVAGVGTGGTISGTGKRLREAFPDIQIVAVEPERNAVLSTGVSGDDNFQGMGPGFVSENLDQSIIDEIKTVALEDAEQECRRLAKQQGILVGQSSGAMSITAKSVARQLPEGSLVVTVFWDSGERYLSTGLFDE